MFNKFWITFITLCTLSTANANWPNQSVQLINQYNSDNDLLNLNNKCQLIEDYFLGKFLNNFQTNSDYFKETTIPLTEKTFLIKNVSKTKSGYSDYLDILESKSFSKNETIFIFPGVFQDYYSQFPLVTGAKLNQMGFNVIIFSSPLSTTQLNRFSLINPGNYFKEAEIYKKAVDEYIKNNPSKTKTVHMLGISYGSFIASEILLSDTNNSIKGSLTLFGPQAYMSEGVTQFDIMIQEGQANEGLCSYLVSNILNKDLKVFTLGLIKKFKYIKENELEEYILNYKKNNSYEVLNKAYLEIGSQIGSHDKEWDPNELPNQVNDFLSEFSFKKTIWTFTPEVIPLYEKKQASVAKILKKIKRTKKNNIRIFIGEDDVISTPDSWKLSGFSNLIEENTLIRRNGSHLAFSAESWFLDFLEASF